MLHLALVQNILTAIGAAPYLGRPNFPLPPHAYPAGIQMALLPFGESRSAALRLPGAPEGTRWRTWRCSRRSRRPLRCRPCTRTRSGPRSRTSRRSAPCTGPSRRVSRSSSSGSARRACSSGRRHAQATRSTSAGTSSSPSPIWPPRVGAIDTIVEQGEGARGDWHDAHFGRLVAILDEYLAMQAADPAFEPARPVLAACVREPEDGAAVPIISDPFTSSLHGPPQRRLRGPAAAPGALLRPHRRDRRAARDAGRRRAWA